MKVIIGPYKNWIGPYQIADKIFFWQDKYNDDCVWADRAHRFGTWLAENKDGSDSWLLKLCNWIHSKRKRHIYVRIDNYDVWNMDCTLRHIIGPMFVKLKAAKHGSPNVDDEDVPEHLRSTTAKPKENDWDIDELFHKRYEWILDELIWAFTSDHEANREKFYDWSQVDKKEDNLQRQLNKLKVDDAALEAYELRLQTAYKLFGKYYQTFWD